MPEPSVEVMPILKDRYLNEVENSWQEATIRIGNEVARAEHVDRQKFADLFSEMMFDMYFIPGGRILRNAGRTSGSMMNCYSIPIGDSREQIGQFYKENLILWGEGGGIGTNLSPLRPRNAPIMGVGGCSSGPVSFLIASDAIADTVESGGSRRAAGLAMLNIEHPDVMEFIDAKTIDKKLSHYNISVAITEEFITAVERDEDWTFKFAQKPWGTIKARELWDKIIFNMVKYAEPGLINWNNFTSNNSYYFSPIYCFSGDTLISTTQGLIPVKDLVEYPEFDVVSDLRVIGSSGTFIEKGKAFKTGRKELFEIKLANNQKIKLTDSHKVYTGEGWKQVKDLIVDADYMFVQTSISSHYVGNLNNIEEIDDGFLVGYLVGDGSIHHYKDRNKVQYHFTAHEDDVEIMKFIKNKINRLKKGKTKRDSNWNRSFGKNKQPLRCFELSSSDDGVREFFSQWGYCPITNKYGYVSCNKKSSKFISDKIMKSSPSFIRGFISGLFAADGHIHQCGNNKNCTKYNILLSTAKSHIASMVQILLNSFGIESKVGSRITKLNDKLYTAYTLTISKYESCIAFKTLIGLDKSVKQVSLNKQSINFTSKYDRRHSSFYKIKSITNVGIEDVYDVETSVTHSLIANGMIVHNSSNPCGEAVLDAYGCCDLGSLVLPKFIKGASSTNWKKLGETIELAVRFLDNVIDTNRYVIKEIDIKAHQSRRIGLGVMGLAEYLFAKKLRYGSPKALEETEQLMKFIRNRTYETLVKLATEKGAFPRFDPVMYGKAHFIRSLPASLRTDIKTYGARCVTGLAMAPTGTISLIAETTSGIEPLSYKAYLRKDRISERMYIHPLYKDIINNKESIPEWFVDSSDLKAEDHLEQQSIVQKYTDGGVSKTILLSNKSDKNKLQENLSKLMLEYLHDLKGVTTYVDGSREGQPINKVTRKEVEKYLSKDREIAKAGIESVECATGSCEL